ncbi:hypothetical protein C8R44DRAFT_868718 [Mycena epipterygia]|nr:hypothetical protein C8R44DRAFT_868718 [Mycena epipterygia]
MTSDLLPSFPLELEREIFETAALQHPATVPSLLLVARRVLAYFLRDNVRHLLSDIWHDNAGSTLRADVAHYADLVRLPAFTHLTLSAHRYPELLVRLLRGCMHLRALVFCRYMRGSVNELSDTISIDDPCFVLMKYPTRDDRMEDRISGVVQTCSLRSGEGRSNRLLGVGSKSDGIVS